MSTANLFMGGAVVAAAMQALASSFLPDITFLTVHGVSYTEGRITADRTINKSTVADWRVTVVPVGEDSPACNTQPGTRIHQGWSAYTKGTRKSRKFTMDMWVGDPGCSERLEAGKPYMMFMSWTPRGDADQVGYKIVFTP